MGIDLYMDGFGNSKYAYCHEYHENGNEEEVSKWEKLSRDEQKAICKSCPVRHRNLGDCDYSLASAGELGRIYDGLALLFYCSSQIADIEKKQMQKQFADTFLAGLAKKEHILISTINELKEKYSIDKEVNIDAGKKGIGFYQKTMNWIQKVGYKALFGFGPDRSKDNDLANGLLGVLIFNDASGEKEFSIDDMEYLLPRLSLLADYCNEVIFLVKPTEYRALFYARNFLMGLSQQMDIALRLGLRIRVSA